MAIVTVNVRGKGTVKLSEKDFLSSGGEGKIYRKGKTVYKVYLDPKKMIPIAKIGELAALDRPNIVRPREVLQNSKGIPVGFTMEWVPNNVALCRLFTNDFRNKNSITPESTVKLVDAIQEGIVFIHDQKCLIVDGNEMNYLVDGRTFEYPYFIDVDSYQTPNFSATALMSSVKDWHTKGFTTLSDWFAFGVVACQLFIGIHPYKGKHPSFKKKDIEERMRRNISIFNPDVTLPSAARDFSNIPSKIRDWFIQMFEKGKRIPPPQVAGLLNVISVKATLIQSTNNFIIKTLISYTTEIIKHYAVNGKAVTVTQDRLYIGKADYPFASPDIDVVFTRGQFHPLAIELINDTISLRRVRDLYPFHTQGIDNRIDFPLAVTKKMVVKNTLFTIYEGKITEILFNEFGDKIIVSAKASWDIMPQSSQVFDGIIYQDVLGKGYLVIPEPEDPPTTSQSRCHIIPVPELDGYRVIDAKYDGGVGMIIGHREGKYDKIILRFSLKHDSYQCRILEDIEQGSINFTTIPTTSSANGLTISINDDNSLEIFPRNPANNKISIIQDPEIDSSMCLSKDGTRVVFFKGKTLYSLRTK